MTLIEWLIIVMIIFILYAVATGHRNHQGGHPADFNTAIRNNIIVLDGKRYEIREVQ